MENEPKKIRMVSLSCTNCGANLDVDLDNMMVYCPFCGQKLMIDVAQMQDILINREDTKRLGMQYKHEKEMKEMENREQWKWVKVLGIGSIVFLLIMFLLDFLAKQGFL